MAQVYDIQERVQAAQEAATQAVQAETAARPVRRRRAILFQGYVILVVSAFTVLAFLARSTAYFPVDLSVTRDLQAYKGAWFDDLMYLISFPGFAPQVLVIAALIVGLLAWLRLRWEAVVAAGAAVGTDTINVLIKTLVHRPRPAANLVDVHAILQDYSFPSGHVMFYVGFYGFLLFLAFTLLKPGGRRALLLLVLGVFIVLVGPSRIYLGQHWFSDVLGAYLLGSLCLLAAVGVYHQGKERGWLAHPASPAT